MNADVDLKTKKLAVAALTLIVFVISINVFSSSFLQAISFFDLVGKAIIIVLTTALLCIILNATISRKTFLSLFIGFSLYFLGSMVDLYNELYDNKKYDLFEDIGIPIGMLFTCFGLYFWFDETRSESRRRYELATEAGKVGVWEWNLQNGNFFIDPHLIHMLGYTGLEIPRTLEEWHKQSHPDDQSRLKACTEGFAQGKQASIDGLVHRMIRKDGKELWLLCRGKLFYDKRDQPYKFLATETDISERVELEERLSHAQKMDAIGKLAKGVAHVFNDQLTVILANAQMIQPNVIEDQKNYSRLKDIETAASRGADLVKQLLAFSSAKKQASFPINVNFCVSTVTAVLSRAIGNEIKIETDLSSESLMVEGDENLINQVLVNIGLNAADAITAALDDQKMPVLKFATSIQSISSTLANQFHINPTDAYICISISDTGKGMNKELIERIFEPFYTTKGLEYRTGLGLSISYSAVKEHRGAIQVQSQIGQGTTFNIYLPKLVESQAA